MSCISVVAEMQQEEGGVTAMNFFTVDHSTFLSVLSFIATYFIILLQYPTEG